MTTIAELRAVIKDLPDDMLVGTDEWQEELTAVKFKVVDVFPFYLSDDGETRYATTPLVPSETPRGEPHKALLISEAD